MRAIISCIESFVTKFRYTYIGAILTIHSDNGVPVTSLLGPPKEVSVKIESYFCKSSRENPPWITEKLTRQTVDKNKGIFCASLNNNQRANNKLTWRTGREP